MSLCPLRLALRPEVFTGPVLAGLMNPPSEPTRPAPYVETLAIVSRTGDGALVGWSEYSHARFDPAAPIKYLSRTLAGSITQTSYTGPDGTGAPIYYSPASPPYPATGSASVRWEGTATRDETGLTDAASRYEINADAGGFLPESGPFAVSDLASLGNVESGAVTTTAAATVKTVSGVGTVNDERTYAPRGSFTATGTATETLSNPDTFFNALTRAAATVGTSATTSPGTVSDTSPETTAPQSFTGVTAVRVTGRIVGGLVGATYGVRADLATAQISPPALGIASAWLSVTCTDEAETLFAFDVPVTANTLTRFTAFSL